ncbi:MAG: adenylate kinase [Rubripirellula sp.]
MRIVFIGPPGAGKGTQCKRLASHLEIPHLSTGEMLRDTPRGSELAELVSSYIDAGQLAPDELVMPIVIDRLADEDCAQGCLFDGFPRTVNQAEMLDRFLGERDDQLNLVLHLDVNVDELVGRLLKRAEVENRVDDTKETIAARLAVFREQTAPVLDYYAREGRVEKIDGMRSPDDVFSQIVQAVDARRSS